MILNNSITVRCHNTVNHANSNNSGSSRGRSDFITKFKINLGSREVINHQREISFASILIVRIVQIIAFKSAQLKKEKRFFFDMIIGEL